MDNFVSQQNLRLQETLSQQRQLVKMENDALEVRTRLQREQHLTEVQAAELSAQPARPQVFNLGREKSSPCFPVAPQSLFGGWKC